MLDIQHYQVGELHKPVKLFNKRLIVRFKGDAGGINTGMHVMLLCNGEKVDEKIHLHQGLASGNGDASVFIKIFISLILFENLLRLHHGAAGHGPGIRIMAVGAAHGTALYKNDKTRSRSVYGSKAF